MFVHNGTQVGSTQTYLTYQEKNTDGDLWGFPYTALDDDDDDDYLSNISGTMMELPQQDAAELPRFFLGGSYTQFLSGQTQFPVK